MARFEHIRFELDYTNYIPKIQYVLWLDREHTKSLAYPISSHRKTPSLTPCYERSTCSLPINIPKANPSPNPIRPCIQYVCKYACDHRSKPPLLSFISTYVGGI